MAAIIGDRDSHAVECRVCPRNHSVERRLPQEFFQAGVIEIENRHVLVLTLSSARIAIRVLAKNQRSAWSQKVLCAGRIWRSRLEYVLDVGVMRASRETMKFGALAFASIRASALPRKIDNVQLSDSPRFDLAQPSMGIETVVAAIDKEIRDIAERSAIGALAIAFLMGSLFKPPQAPRAWAGSRDDGCRNKVPEDTPSFSLMLANSE
ncbi:MAG: hypothetical protein JWM35_2265 [Verrucomicrobia bacterium]|nr:hypothetical protein [Verrucomicrobiota bacterium]